VSVSLNDGLLRVRHRGVLIATLARRHLPEHDVKFTDRPRALRASPQTMGDVVYRHVDGSGAISFAGTSYRASEADGT
jgi:hypothetical protein